MLVRIVLQNLPLQTAAPSLTKSSVHEPEFDSPRFSYKVCQTFSVSNHYRHHLAGTTVGMVFVGFGGERGVNAFEHFPDSLACYKRQF